METDELMKDAGEESPDVQAYSAPSDSKVIVEDDLSFIGTEAADLVEGISEIDAKKVHRIKRPEDHIPRYNIKRSDLAEANKKMANISTLPESPKEPTGLEGGPLDGLI